MASLVMGVGAAALLAPLGPLGASIGFALGSAAAGLLFPPKGPDGPRLGDLSVQSSAYGNAIPIPYGTDRVAGNIIWADKIQEHEHEEGGKGGPEYTTYSYTCSFASSIVAGPIAGILRIWADGLLIYDRRPTNTGKQIGFRAGSYKIYLGTETQLPDPTIQAIIGDTPAYRGQAYIVFSDLELGKFGNRIPSLSFEYVADGAEVDPVVSMFGERTGLSSGGATDDPLTWAMDTDTGHLWVSTLTGHARRDPVTGEYSIDPGYGPVPQIQEYDAATKELIYVIEPPPVVEGNAPIYPFQGKMIYSGGHIFIGRGQAGGVDGEDGPISYAHGAAVDTRSHQLSYLYSECSHEQFQNAFYWPTVPVPVIDNNKVYMASGNGGGSGLAIGFGPASIMQAGGAEYPVPDRTQPEAMWNVPAGWRQVRPESGCPVSREADYVSMQFTDWAMDSTLIDNGRATVVVGYGGNAGPYLTWVANEPASTANALDLTPPGTQATVHFPGNTVTMPVVAWDAENATLWAFGGGGETESETRFLYAVHYQGGELTLTNTGFAFPQYDRDVRGVTIDTATGLLRILRAKSTSDPAELLLFDPINLTVVETQPLDVDFAISRGSLYDLPEQGKLIFADTNQIIEIPYGALNANPVNLGAIVADVSRRAGLTLADIDVTELADMVDGYTITHQMAARSALEPLMQAYFFDPVESDYLIKFKKRGRQAVVTIPDEDLAAHSSGSEPPDLIQIKRKQELDLPQLVNVKYKNPGADYQTSTQYEARQTGRSNSTVTVDLPIVIADEKAKQVAAAALYTAWAERTGLSFATDLSYAALEPTDVVIVHNRLVRLVHKKRNGGILEWEGYADGNTIYPSETVNQGGAAAPAGPVDQAIVTTPLSALQIFGTPLLQDTDTSPGFYLAAAGLAPGWTGAQVWKSVDGGVSYSAMTSVPNASLIGTASGALGAYYGGDTFDELNAVTVKLLANGSTATPASATEAAVLNGANAVLIGSEVLQYKRAVLNDDGSYTLSGLLRYRRGTNGVTHAAGERVVFLSANLVRVAVPTSEIGLPRMYKAISNGGTLAEAPAVSFTYDGADLKPYAPVQIGGWRDADGNLTLTWVRRTRTGGELRDGVDAALGESAEEYEVEIVSGGTVKRTIAGLATPTTIYSAANQAADGITPGSPVSVRVCQRSSVIGRGFPGSATV